jgi:hypothetical protein
MVTGESSGDAGMDTATVKPVSFSISTDLGR